MSIAARKAAASPIQNDARIPKKDGSLGCHLLEITYKATTAIASKTICAISDMIATR